MLTFYIRSRENKMLLPPHPSNCPPPIKDAGVMGAGGSVNQPRVPGVNRRQVAVSLSHDQATMTRA